MNTIEDNLNQRISARIRIERESRGWSLNDLAERAGASRAMIHKIERGESSPTASMLGRLSGAFGISMSTLIARAEMQEGKLLVALIAEARRLNKHVMVAGIESQNHASLHLHETLGFITTGQMPQVGTKFGRWLDLTFMQLQLDARQDPDGKA